MIDAEYVSAFWEFFKKFAAEVGGAIPAALIGTSLLLVVLSYKNPEKSFEVLKNVLYYFFGMVYHPVIIRQLIDQHNVEQSKLQKEVQKLQNELHELNVQVSSFESKITTIFLILLKNKVDPYVAEEIHNILNNNNNNDY